LVQRVVRAVQTAQERGGELKLRLSPPELGSLRLQVRLVDGTLSARIEAETPAARQALTDGLPALRERLAEQNIRVERFDVDLFNFGGGGASQMPRQQHDRQDQAAHEVGPVREGQVRAAAETNTTATPVAAIIADGRLNVVV
jgi:flagellar hook-length control protein FliK